MNVYKKVTVIGYTNDFGVMKDEKTGKPQAWSGKRAVLQELTFDANSKTAFQGLTFIDKCAPDFVEVPCGSVGTPCYNRGGKLIKIECGKSNG